MGQTLPEFFCGQVFRWRGLPDREFRFEEPDGDRTLTVLGISVDGQIQIKIEMDGVDYTDERRDPGLIGVAYSDALLMRRTGAWVEILDGIHPTGPDGRIQIWEDGKVIGEQG